MGDEELTEESAPSDGRRFLRGLISSASLSRAICLSVANIAVLAVIYLTCRHGPLLVHWQAQVIVAYAVLFSSGFVAVHQWIYWAKPTRRLSQLLPLVQRGHEPIEELGKIRGGMTELVAQTQQLLREIRRQKAEVSQLETELNQRVASRTDALERSLGVMKQHASRDALTGLLNRRVLDETLPAMMERCRAESLPLSLLMIDVDNFKPLNDTLGHAAGDDLLRSLGQLFRSDLLDGDSAFRYGGDEFVLLLPAATRDEAKARAHRLAKLVEVMTRNLVVAKAPQLSIGLLSLADAPGADPESFLRAADRLLYRIKATRRGRRASDTAPKTAAG
jgi:diguanylate cyclase (GGDEF)-like protein